MSAEFVPLAIIMFVFTYPSRAVGLLAPGIDRLPRQVLAYLQLVGPAVLAALAAVDIMVGTGNPIGYEIAAYVREHARELGVSQVIWHQHIWTAQLSGGGWRPMKSRGSATANHMDHVHVTTYGNAAK